MKIVGALFILYASFSAAFVWNNNRSTWLREMDRFRAALRQLDLELSSRGEGLPTLIKRLGDNTQGMAGGFFRALALRLDRLGERPFSLMWEETFSEYKEHFSADELSELLPLGKVLGRLPIPQQHQEIADCLRKLEILRDQERSRFDRDRKLILPLSACAALFLLILLA